MHIRESSGSKQSWNECARFITNNIYQAHIFSPLLTQKEKAGRKEEATHIKRISPIAWQNVNLLGRFEFHRQQSVINLDEMIRLLEQKIVWQQPKVTEEVLA